jgi:diguanylate cyclase (GGDEF)-like protein
MSSIQTASGHERTYPVQIRVDVLTDRAQHNQSVLRPLSIVATVLCAILLVQHHIAPGIELQWLLRAYSALYIAGLAAGFLTLLLSLTIAHTMEDRSRYAASLVSGALLVLFGAGLSVLDSSSQTESVAFAITLLILVSVFRARGRYYIVVAVSSSLVYILAHTLVWGALTLSAAIETTMISVFAVYVATTLERRRRETFLLRRELHEQNKSLARRQAVDPLTGLWNRAAFLDHLATHTEQFRRYGTPLSVLLVDIDQFRTINDGHGRLTGDAVIKGVADIVVTSIRNSDEAGRYGGEELAVLLTNTECEAAVEVAERIRTSIATKVFTDHAVNVTASVGVAGCCEVDEDPDDTLTRADRALYKAKLSGRDTVCVATEPGAEPDVSISPATK